jgi:F-type H+-transporting ATPase subunit gamma
MAESTRDLKRRIRSITSTRQITKAMELVAASRMRRSVAQVLASRAYASLAWELALHLAERTELGRHPLLTRREVRRVVLVMIASNRGLCGGYNTHVVQQVLGFVRGSDGLPVDLITMGRKGGDAVTRLGLNVVADFPKPDAAITSLEIAPMARLVIDDFVAGTYDRVVIAYTDFVSTLVQRAHLKQLLPLEPTVEELAEQGVSGERIDASNGYHYDYLFEPSPAAVLDELLPRLVEVQVYQALLEADASEHSARMMAMRNASDNASDLIDDLTLTFNKVRQAAVTSEIAEISAGAAALQ